MNKIASIYRYPIKGLSGERLDRVQLTAGEVMPGDREYAFARAGVAFDPDQPEYLQKTNFLALVRDEKLAEFETRLDPTSQTLSILQNNRLMIEVDLSNVAEAEAAAEFFREQLEISPGNPPRLVRATGGTKGHSFSDVPNKAISLISLSSVREFGEKISAEIDPMRFRGNINFDGDRAWQEFDWLDRDLRIGEVVVHVFKR
ncbi:MAG: MOSC domain-containing protein, partial [Rhodospirillaceae bacterium]|nr:MOSC domain-containing protein [Rhodospirillaceae bacterium]